MDYSSDSRPLVFSFYVGFYSKVKMENKMWYVLFKDSQWSGWDISLNEGEKWAVRSLFDDALLEIWIRWSRGTKKKKQDTHTSAQHIASKGGMHPPEIFQTRLVFNVLIGKEQKRGCKKKQQQLNKSVSLWLLCCLFADARALRINMFALNYLFPPGKQPSCGVWMFTRINIICLPVKLAS